VGDSSLRGKYHVRKPLKLERRSRSCVAGGGLTRRRRSRPTRIEVYSLRLGTRLDITVVVNSSCCRCRVSRVAASSFSVCYLVFVWCAAGRRAWARRLAPVGRSCHADQILSVPGHDRTQLPNEARFRVREIFCTAGWRCAPVRFVKMRASVQPQSVLPRQ
jgi:hypothetical protein